MPVVVVRAALIEAPASRRPRAVVGVGRARAGRGGQRVRRPLRRSRSGARRPRTSAPGDRRDGYPCPFHCSKNCAEGTAHYFVDAHSAGDELRDITVRRSQFGDGTEQLRTLTRREHIDTITLQRGTARDVITEDVSEFLGIGGASRPAKQRCHRAPGNRHVIETESGLDQLGDGSGTGTVIDWLPHGNRPSCSEAGQHIGSFHERIGCWHGCSAEQIDTHPDNGVITRCRPGRTTLTLVGMNTPNPSPARSVRTRRSALAALCATGAISVMGAACGSDSKSATAGTSAVPGSHRVSPTPRRGRAGRGLCSLQTTRSASVFGPVEVTSPHGRAVHAAVSGNNATRLHDLRSVRSGPTATDKFLVARSSERSHDSSVKPTEFLVTSSSER
jgi:hypothetical protein